jgi:hypothetical protein
MVEDLGIAFVFLGYRTVLLRSALMLLDCRILNHVSYCNDVTSASVTFTNLAHRFPRKF